MIGLVFKKVNKMAGLCSKLHVVVVQVGLVDVVGLTHEIASFVSIRKAAVRYSVWIAWMVLS